MVHSMTQSEKIKITFYVLILSLKKTMRLHLFLGYFCIVLFFSPHKTTALSFTGKQNDNSWTIRKEEKIPTLLHLQSAHRIQACAGEGLGWVAQVDGVSIWLTASPLWSPNSRSFSSTFLAYQQDLTGTNIHTNSFSYYIGWAKTPKIIQFYNI